MLLSIITPSFNRGYCLHKIYHSLIQFASQDFEWILVDDGSTDDTMSIVQPWLEEKKLNFRYIKQDNTGKTNAVIHAFEQNPNGEYALVLDSDDFLLPNALDLIKQYVLELKQEEIGLVFLKSNTLGEIIGTRFNLDSSTYIAMYFGKYSCYGDKLFVVQTAIYQESLVPAFPGEKLIPEGVIYLNMQQSGKFRCINEILYTGDYLADGLSASTINLAANNINGFILEKRMLQDQPLDLLSSVKNYVKYVSYSIAGKKSLGEIFDQSRNKLLIFLLLIPTWVLSWKRISEIRKIIKKREG
jgi:glycosyltransferase involved in cell wall biosynthesis